MRDPKKLDDLLGALDLLGQLKKDVFLKARQDSVCEFKLDELLKERPLLEGLSLNKLSTYPKGSLGYHYFNFIKKSL